jgi:hypothetical protein
MDGQLGASDVNKETPARTILLPTEALHLSCRRSIETKEKKPLYQSN